VSFASQSGERQASRLSADRVTADVLVDERDPIVAACFVLRWTSAGSPIEGSTVRPITQRASRRSADSVPGEATIDTGMFIEDFNVVPLVHANRRRSSRDLTEARP